MKKHERDPYEEREVPRGFTLFIIVLIGGFSIMLYVPGAINDTFFSAWIWACIITFFAAAYMRAKDQELPEKKKQAEQMYYLYMRNKRGYGKWLEGFDAELYRRWLVELGIKSWEEIPDPEIDEASYWRWARETFKEPKKEADPNHLS